MSVTLYKNRASFARLLTNFSPNPPNFTSLPTTDPYYNNRKINDFIKSGSFTSALKLFDEMPVRDVVTYNMLISSYCSILNPTRSLLLYKEMISHGVKESASTFCSLLSICSKSSGFYQEGIQLHCKVILLGFDMNVYVASSLIDLYIGNGFVDLGLKLFDELSERNLAVWNLVLRAFCELGLSDELLRMYYEMRLHHVEANALTFCYLIKGCSSSSSISSSISDERFFDAGRQLHCHVVKAGFVKSNLFVDNALVDFYSASGSVRDAKRAFNTIAANDVFAWNSMVSVCVSNGLLFEALEYFARMQFWEKRPSIRSFVGFLNYSSANKNVSFGEQIHCYVMKSGFDCESVHVQSALIDMYGKCSKIDKAVSVFDSIVDRSKESCNSLMTSLLHRGFVEDVIDLFGLMVDEGIQVDEVSLSVTLKAASYSFSSCNMLHCHAMKSGFESYSTVSCSLISAYSRSGHIQLAQKVFENILSPNHICFTSMINGYAQNGLVKQSIQMLELMIKSGVEPDKVTILCALTACNHSGMVEEARYIFYTMMNAYKIHPDGRHYSCMVDILGRAGLLDEAENLLNSGSVKGDCVIWSSMLRSCMIHRNEKVGRRALSVLIELQPEDPSVCLQIANFYSEIGEFENSRQMKEMATARKLSKEIGRSLIEVPW